VAAGRVVGEPVFGQERHDRVGDGRGGSPGQVMTRALDELEASIRQGPGQPSGGFEGNHGVPGVGEHEHRYPDRRDGALQLAELAQEGTLLGEKGAPQRPPSVARLAPDLPVDVFVRPQRAAPPPGDPSQPGPGHPRRQLPRHLRAQPACARCGEQPVPAGHASRADAREQDHRRYPARCPARRR
jgi:hypothetical protein